MGQVPWVDRAGLLVTRAPPRKRGISAEALGLLASPSPVTPCFSVYPLDNCVKPPILTRSSAIILSWPGGVHALADVLDRTDSRWSIVVRRFQAGRWRARTPIRFP